MSAGLVAFLVSLAVFLVVYSVVTPTHELPEEGVEALLGLDPSPASNLFEKYVRPAVRNILPQTPMSATLKARQSDKVTELLVRSGNPWNLQPEEYYGVMLVFGIGGFLLGMVVGLEKVLPFPTPAIMVAGTLLGAYYVKVKHDGARGRRRKEGRKGLPEALDLLRISMLAGQQFAPALVEVSNRLPEGLIKNEMTRVSEELQAGRTREAALIDFARRSASDEVEAFCKAVIQAEALGADITNTLEAQSVAARQSFEADLDVRINKLPTILFFPILGLMLPALFVVILAPALTNIGKAF